MVLAEALRSAVSISWKTSQWRVAGTVSSSARARCRPNLQSRQDRRFDADAPGFILQADRFQAAQRLRERGAFGIRQSAPAERDQGQQHGLAAPAGLRR